MRAMMPSSSIGGVVSAASTGWFRELANKTAYYSGRPITFGIAFAIVAIWGITGPLFHYSDTWQLVINTGTTIVTFLMVFLIQATQNRDTTAIQLKLDELIHAVGRARNGLIAVEELSDEELQALKEDISKLRREPDSAAAATERPGAPARSQGAAA
jgi:low affinity Fe/Cu permease